MRASLASPFGRGGRAQRGRRGAERSSGPPCGPVFPRCPQAAESPGRRGGPPPGGQAQCRFTVCPPGDGPPRRPGPTAGHPTPQQAATTTAPPHGTPPPPPPQNQTGAAAARAAPPTGGAIQIVAPATQSYPRLRGRVAGDTGGGVGGKHHARQEAQARRAEAPRQRRRHQRGDAAATYCVRGPSSQDGAAGGRYISPCIIRRRSVYGFVPRRMQ